MKKTMNRICIALLCILYIVVSVMPCYAADTHGTITVVLEDAEKHPLDGIPVHLCKIADMDSNGYYPAAAFTNAGLSLAAIINNPSESAANDVATYITEHAVSFQSAVSATGKAVFQELEMGIWLVFCDENSSFIFNPFFVFLPSASGGKLYYEVSSTPKIEDNEPHLCNVHVMKRWDDKNNAAKKRPDSVTVELLDGDTVISSAVLSEQNGWTHTFTDLAKSGNYAVRETAVAYYEAQYDGDWQNGFIITNTYTGEKRPQTGQL